MSHQTACRAFCRLLKARTMADVFISYASGDRKIAENLALFLSSNNYEVWWDYDLVGGVNFRKEILKRLISARAVVVLWSKLSVESQFVIDEAQQAEKGEKLIPVRLPDTAIDELPLGFRGLQTIAHGENNRILTALGRLGLQPSNSRVVESAAEPRDAPTVKDAMRYLKLQPAHVVERCAYSLAMAVAAGYVLIKIKSSLEFEAVEMLTALTALKRDDGGGGSFFRYEITSLGRALLVAMR
jgi:hypothetical protein